MKLRFSSTLLAAVLACGSLSAIDERKAFAGDKVLAQALFDDGVKLMKQGRFPEACPKLDESQRQDPATGTLNALAQCNEKIGKTATAWEQYRELTVSFKKLDKADASQAAAGRAAALEPKLSKLQINAVADTPGLVIRRDDHDVGKAVLGTPMPIDPGTHVIEATAPGYQVWQTTVIVGQNGDVKTVAIPALSAAAVAVTTTAPKGPNPAIRIAGFVIGGVGVAGVAVGAVFGGLALSQASGACKNNVCTSSGASAINDAGTKGTISTLGIGIGAAALVTGIVLVVVGTPKKEKASLPPVTARFIPSVGPQSGGLSVAGSF